jgi:hypothetical protein
MSQQQFYQQTYGQQVHAKLPMFGLVFHILQKSIEKRVSKFKFVYVKKQIYLLNHNQVHLCPCLVLESSYLQLYQTLYTLQQYHPKYLQIIYIYKIHVPLSQGL